MTLGFFPYGEWLKYRQVGDALAVAIDGSTTGPDVIAGGIRRIRHRGAEHFRLGGESEEAFLMRVIVGAPKREDGRLESQIFLCFYEGRN